MIQQSAGETKYVKVGPVKATVNGNAAIVTNDGVQMAFMSIGSTPGTNDWKNGSWETIGTSVYARCLVGPTGVVTLTAGNYAIWVKIVDNPETVQEFVDNVTVY